MKEGPFTHSPQKMREDENDPLNDAVWRLLARAPLPEADAWFTARAVARCRNEDPGMDESSAGLSRFTGFWRWTLGGGLALCMALVLVVTQVQSENEKADKQKNVQEAFEIMASIDSDTDSSSSSSSWQDSSL